MAETENTPTTEQTRDVALPADEPADQMAADTAPPVDPAEALAALQATHQETLAQLEAKTQEAESLAQQLEALRTTQQDVQTQLDAESEQAAKYRTLYEQHAIRSALLAACTEAINPEMVLKLLDGQVELAEDGAVTINGQTAQEAVAAFLEQNPFLAKPRGSAGSGAPLSGSTSSGNNPWSQAHFNMTEQARILRENPAEAERLKRAAGL